MKQLSYTGPYTEITRRILPQKIAEVCSENTADVRNLKLENIGAIADWNL